MKKIFFILILLPGLLSAQNLRRWGSTGAISTLHGNWFYNAHPAYLTGDSLKLVDFKLLKDTAAALRAAGGGGSGMSIGGTVTSGTTGSVLFIGGSSALAQDNSNFFWDNTNKRLGIGTATPAYRFDVLRVATGQAASSRTLNISTTGSTFNMTAAAYTNHAGYFSADASVSTGAFSLTNIGVMGMATGGDANYGVATSNSSFTGLGYFYQSANNTTKIQGGPGTDNIQFGADNRIRLNTPSVIIPSGSFSVGSNSDDGLGQIQVYGKETLYTIDSSASPANMLFQDPVTKEIKKAAVPSATPGTVVIVNDADHTVTSTESAIRYHNNITANRTVTIPNPSAATNREIWVKWNTINGGSALNITTTTGTALIYLDGTTSSATYNITASFQSALLKSDGTSWYKIN